MQSERCATLSVTALGADGDRRFAFESTDAPVGKPLLRSAQRAAMLRSAATLDAAGNVSVAAGQTRPLPVDDDALLSLIAGPDVAGTLTLRRGERPFTDVRPLALHSVATVRALAQAVDGFDGRRLRSNLVLALEGDEPFAEDRFAGRTLQLGPAVQLSLLERIPRCRMVSLDPETAAADSSSLRWLASHHDGRAGIYARALVPGTVSLGDEVSLVS